MTPLQLPIRPGPARDAGRAIIRLAPEDLARGGLRPGDIVALTGARTTHVRLLPGRGADGSVAADSVTAENAGAHWGDMLSISAALLPEAAEAHLSVDHSIGVADLHPVLLDMPLTEGDRCLLPARVTDGLGSAQPVDARIVRLVPPGAGQVGPTTKLHLAPATPERPYYPGIAGLDAQIDAVHETIELPLERPDLFERLGLDAPRGVLFTGPPGSGKTLLARALADRTVSSFFHVAGPEIVSKHYGESERALRDVFDAAAQRAPAIIFIDEIDAIAPRREGLSGEKQVERRVVGQLLTLLDGLTQRDRVIIIAATNLPDALDPALRRPGRFDREIAFTPPDAEARRAILRLHLAQAPLAENVDLRSIARRCAGYLGADLAALTREAGLAALARCRAALRDGEDLVAESVFVTNADLETARARTRPSLLRADPSDTAPPSWSDIGGQEAAKAKLTEAVLWPLRHRDAHAELRLAPPRGILLTGAPGTGKTLLVRALATESGMNFIPVRTSNLLSQFLGEAERAIEAVFSRARLAAPALLFFDELDTLAPERGRADAATDRVVAQLLTEMDGLSENIDIVILAATNRPDRIDPALLRPGRFDIVIPVAAPDADGRAEVLEVHTRGRSLSEDVSLEALAAQAEGATPADLASLVTDAARRGLGRWRATGQTDTPEIAQQDLDGALAAHKARRAALKAANAAPSPALGTKATARATTVNAGIPSNGPRV